MAKDKVVKVEKSDKPEVAEKAEKAVKAVKSVKSENVVDLKQQYRTVIIKQMMDKYKYKNIHQVPKIEKIVINRGVGESTTNSKAIQTSVDEFKAIFGQQPLVTKAKKSIASFKIREGMPIGCKLTLRGDRMYDFMTKLFNLVLPKIRDFKGVPTRSFDKQANYTLGLREQLIFPEVNYDKIEHVRGFDITFVTTATDVAEARELLALMGMPFRKQ